MVRSWNPGWLDAKVGGVPIRSWCKRVKGDFVECKICKVQFSYRHRGLCSFQRHYFCNKHQSEILKEKGKSKLKRPVNHPTVKSYTLPFVTKLKTPTLERLKNHIYYKQLNPLSVQIKNQEQRNDPKLNQRKDCRNKLVEVYVCYYCGEEFNQKTELQSHRDECDLQPPDLAAITPPGQAVLPTSDENNLPPCLDIPTSDEKNSPPCLDMTSTSLFTDSTKPRLQDFVSGLGLIPKKEAAKVTRSRNRRNTECETLDLDEVKPFTPSNRRSKCLLSHLSKESETLSPTFNPFFRKQLLFTSDDVNPDIDNETDNTSETKDNHISVNKSLYTIDLTSRLGQMVIKQIKGDPSLHVLSDIESHCLTETSKSSPHRPLRNRITTFPITFKGYSRKTTEMDFFHQYKFEKWELREFMRRKNSGLDRRSRFLRKRMKPCRVFLRHITKSDLRQWIPSQNNMSVSLQPLTKEEIMYWLHPKPIENPAVFSKGVNFESPDIKDILGLRTKQQTVVKLQRLPLLTIANYVSEEALAEIIQNKKILYKSLLTDNSLQYPCRDKPNENIPVAPNNSALLRQMLNSPFHASAKPTENVPRKTCKSHYNTRNSSECDLLSKVNRSLSTKSWPDNYKHLPGSKLYYDSKNIENEQISTHEPRRFLTTTKMSGHRKVEIRSMESEQDIYPLQELVADTAPSYAIPGDQRFENDNSKQNRTELMRKLFEKPSSSVNSLRFHIKNDINSPNTGNYTAQKLKESDNSTESILPLVKIKPRPLLTTRNGKKEAVLNNRLHRSEKVKKRSPSYKQNQLSSSNRNKSKPLKNLNTSPTLRRNKTREAVKSRAAKKQTKSLHEKKDKITASKGAKAKVKSSPSSKLNWKQTLAEVGSIQSRQKQTKDKKKISIIIRSSVKKTVSKTNRKKNT